MDHLIETKNGWMDRPAVSSDHSEENSTEQDNDQSASETKHAINRSPKRIPNPEVSAKAERRTYTAEYKLRMLEEHEACGHGEVGAFLRREGLYSSTMSRWKIQRDSGALRALEPQQRGPKPTDADSNDAKMAELESENKRLKEKLRKAELTIDVQKKVSELLGLSLNNENNEKR